MTSNSSFRFRRGVVQEEDAAQLKLGEDFQHAQCLFISEVQILLEHKKEKVLNEAGSMGDKNLTSIFQKTLAYTQLFSKFNNRESVREVRQLFSSEELESFEIAQLANLCCETPEEAKAYIPSLSQRKDDDELQTLLNELTTLREYQR